MENQIRCDDCGALSSATSKFCNNCGSMLADHQSKQAIAKPPVSNNFLSKYKAGVIVFCSLGFLALIFPPVNWYINGNLVRFELVFILSLGPKNLYGGQTLIGEINSILLSVELLIIFILSIAIQIAKDRLKNKLQTVTKTLKNES
jgi:hypothetical protein